MKKSGDNKRVYGPIAQEVQRHFPEAIGRTDDGHLSLSFDPITVGLINSVKELKKENDFLKTQLQEVRSFLCEKYDRSPEPPFCSRNN